MNRVYRPSASSLPFSRCTEDTGSPKAEGSKLLYVSRTRNGFTPRLREELLKRFRDLEIGECPFANLRQGRTLGAGSDGGKDG